MIGLSGHETLDLGTMDREYAVYLAPLARGIAEPFHVSASVSFSWCALLTARMATVEEDVLTELLGYEDANGVNTEQPWVRIDISLRAGLEWDKSLPLPKSGAWAEWVRETMVRLERVEPIVSTDVASETSGGHHAVLAWQGDPQITVGCNPNGELRLQAVEVHAFQGVDVPRSWDDPERTPDADPHEQLVSMFARVRAALHAWGEAMDHLLPKKAG